MTFLVQTLNYFLFYYNLQKVRNHYYTNDQKPPRRPYNDSLVVLLIYPIYCNDIQSIRINNPDILTINPDWFLLYYQNQLDKKYLHSSKKWYTPLVQRLVWNQLSLWWIFRYSISSYGLDQIGGFQKCKIHFSSFKCFSTPLLNIEITLYGLA